jgi:WD40 repeat protein
MIGQPISTFTNFVAFVPSTKLLAFGRRQRKDRRSDGEFRLSLWDTSNQKEIRSWEAPTYLNHVAISLDGKMIASGHWDGKRNSICIWNVLTGQERRFDVELRGRIYAISFSPDGKSLATGGGGYDKHENFGEIKVWDVATGGLQFELSAQSEVHTVRFSPVGRLLAVGESMGRTILWKVADRNRPEVAWEDSIRANSTSMVFSSDGHLLARCSGRAIQVLDVVSGVPQLPLGGQTGELKHVAFTFDDKVIVSSGHRVHAWDVAKGKESLVLPGPLPLRKFPPYGVYCSALTPDGKALITGSHEGTFLWDLASGHRIRSFTVEYGYAVAAAISPEGKTLATSNQLQIPMVTDGQYVIHTRNESFLRIWDMGSGKELRQFANQPGGIRFMTFSPDGAKLAVSTNIDSGTVQVWQVATGKLLSTICHRPGMGGGDGPISFSPDGRVLALGNQDLVQLWDVATDQEIRRLLGHRDRITATAFSPDGKTVLSASRDNTVRVWEVISGNLIHELRGHRDEVLSAAFSQDGKRIASASADSTVLIWDVKELQNATHQAPLGPRTEELRALWEGLSIDRYRERSIRLLVAGKDSTVDFLRTQLPNQLPHQRRVSQVLADLDNDSYEKREAASHELEKLGEAAVPGLVQTLCGNPSVEARSRVRLALKEYKDWIRRNQGGNADGVRLFCAVSILARIGTAEANQTLTTLVDHALVQLVRNEGGDPRSPRPRESVRAFDRAFSSAVRDLEVNAKPEAKQFLKVIQSAADRLTRAAQPSRY